MNWLTIIFQFSAYSLVKLYVCFYCDEDFSTTEELARHRKVCKNASPDTSDMCTPTRPAALTLSGRSRRASSRSFNIDKWSFASALGLHSISKRKNLRVSTRKQINLDKIDVDRELPRSPTTPRTPKSLISQLSRASETENSDVDSDCGKPETSEDGKARTKWNRLLSIEISSFLGQKLMPHLTVISQEKTQNTDYEHYCKTPIKNAFLQRLRTRPSLPKVPYKPRRMHQNYHIYKFNKKQTREFMLKMKTGLNKKSRAMKKKMIKLSVNLDKLNKQDLLKYRVSKKQLKDFGFMSNTRKIDPEASKPSEFPLVPVLRENEDKLRNLLGLRTNSVPIRRSLINELNLSQVVSEDVLAEVMKQQVVVYKSVLSELTDSPVSTKGTSPGKTVESVLCNKPHGNSADMAGSDCDSTSSRRSRRENRKRDFSNVCSDTDICSPKRKKAKQEFSPDKIKPNVTGVFSCGICGFEMTVDNNVQKAVESHFADKHDINDVTIHKDSSDSLVVVRSPVRKNAKVSFIDLTEDSDEDCRQPRKAGDNQTNANESEKLIDDHQKSLLPHRMLRSNSDSGQRKRPFNDNSDNSIGNSLQNGGVIEAKKRNMNISGEDHNSSSAGNKKCKRSQQHDTSTGDNSMDSLACEKKRCRLNSIRHSPRRFTEDLSEHQSQNKSNTAINPVVVGPTGSSSSEKVVKASKAPAKGIKPSKAIAVVERPVTRRFKNLVKK